MSGLASRSGIARSRLTGAGFLLLATAAAFFAVASGSAPAAAEDLPNSLGIPGLGWTHSVPERRSSPLRFGLQYSTGSFDPEQGIQEVSLDSANVSSRELRLILQVRATRSLRLSAVLPFRWVERDGDPSVSGPGDLEGAMALRLFGIGRTTFGAWGGLRIPTGDESRGLSTEKMEGEYGLVNSTRFFGSGFAPPMDVVLNLGYRLNKNEIEGYGGRSGDVRSTGAFFPIYPATPVGEKARYNDQLLLRAAVNFRQRWGAIFLEWSADWLAFADGIGWGESPSWFTPGVELGGEAGPTLRASWSIGFAEDDPSTVWQPRLPDWYAQLSVSMPFFLGGRDRDDDFVPDKHDGCPDTPEDIDGFEDEDGCPDLDNDGDGIEDRYDLAPNLAEDFDGFEDQDGRPDLDNDFDGIPDTEDECPNQPEDFDGDRDQDGCPDVVLDTDGDGILDARDACPDQPEDFDGFEDGDGCPDLDNDLDGVPDAQDLCPDQPEDYDGIEDEDGCPDDPVIPYGTPAPDSPDQGS